MNRIQGVPAQMFLLIFFFFVVILLVYPDSTLDIAHKPLPEAKAEPVSILIVGDLMLDRSVATRMRQFGHDYPFANMPELFGENDLTIANLEGVFSSNTSVALPGSNILRFTFDPTFVPVLAKWGFDAVSQANNHTADFGREAAAQSRELLRAEGISVFGDFYNELDLVTEKEVKGKKIAFVAYNDFAPGLDRVKTLITKTKADNDFVIVMPHWGEEYATTSNARQQRTAREFIDAGADLVVGAHPHVVQERAEYKGKSIFYSLGNFVFDQDFSRETTEGLAVRVEITEEKLEYKLLPFAIRKSRVEKI